MNRQKEVFAKQILKSVGEWAQHKNDDSSVFGFFASKGIYYDKNAVKLMVVGRALYGWENPIQMKQLINGDKAKEFTESSYQIVYNNKECPLKWVTRITDDYNPHRSAFWRVINQIVSELGISGIDDIDWSSNIVWTNLYKINPKSGGNPSDPLCNAQYVGCRELLQVEIDEYQPSHILFITGLNWAYPFLIDLKGFDCNTIQGDYIDASGIYHADDFNAKVVVSGRPERKQQSQFVEAVMKELRQ